VREELVRSGSAWSAAGIRQYLAAAEIPVRLACLATGGTPLLCSLWFLCDDDAIWCATPHSARLAVLLQRDPRCAFEVAGDLMPYRGVRGQGVARLSRADGPAVLLRLIDRYLHSRESAFARWLMSRQQDEVAIRIDPEWLTAWDFSSRMRP
jgi:hypothetical protein